MIFGHKVFNRGHVGFSRGQGVLILCATGE
jgi:hypothetical protein